MPPEQIRGQDVNRAADVYAASVVLWEALTCSRLFGGGNDGEVVYRVMEGQIPPPSKVRPEIPRDLDQIVLRGLHKNPAERYQTARAMAADLERAATPVTRHTVSTWVLECVPEEIQRREECVSRVESTATPVPATSLAPPPFAAAGDSTLSRMGSLSQSVAPGGPAPGSGGSRGKKVLFGIAAVATLALAGLTPTLLRGSSESGETKAASIGKPAEIRVAEAPASKPADPAVERAAAAPVPAPAPSTEASADPAAETASPPSQSTRRRAAPTSNAKRSRSKGGSFDRIYRRD
jgi:serine/threonine-protein kinase